MPDDYCHSLSIVQHLKSWEGGWQAELSGFFFKQNFFMRDHFIVRKYAQAFADWLVENGYRSTGVGMWKNNRNFLEQTTAEAFSYFLMMTAPSDDN